MQTAPDAVLVPYTSGGAELRGYLVDGAKGGKAPAVLVAHEAIGINDHIRRRTHQFAAMGYVALALDLYGASDLALAEAQTRNSELIKTPGLMRERAKAALDVLAKHASVDPTRIAAVGFCQGGMTVMELARSGADIRAAVGFHPGFKRPAGSADGPITAKVLMMTGDRDPVVSEEDRAAFAAEMRSAGADWQLHVFGGVGHSYTNQAIDALGYPGFAYDADADRRSWNLMMDLLQEVFRVERVG